MHIYCVHIDQVLHETTFQELTQYIVPEKIARINRFRKRIDATRSLLGDLIIRVILCRHYGLHNDEIKYAYQEFGKPYFEDYPQFHFNISHSGDWVVGVVSTASVGIDIEKIADVKTDMYSLVLTDEENKKLQRLFDAERNSFFFELWTLKESYVKATGKGLSEGLNTLQISIDNGTISIKKDNKSMQAYFGMLECIEGYKLSFCSLSKNVYKDIRLFLLSEFSKEVKMLSQHIG